MIEHVDGFVKKSALYFKEKCAPLLSVPDDNFRFSGIVRIGILNALSLIFLNFTLHPNRLDCDDNFLQPIALKIKEHQRKHETIKFLSLSDSAMQMINSKGWQDCPNSLWISLDHGEALELNQRYDEALTLYHELIFKSEKMKKWDLMALANISAARCYESISRSSECLTHLNLSRTLIETHHLDTVLATFSYRYSSYHRLFNNKDTALKYAALSVHLGHLYHVNRAVFDGHLLLGILSKDLDSSIFHFKRAIEIFSLDGDFHGAASQNLNIASKLINAGRYDEAEKEINKSLAYIDKIEKETKNYFYILQRWHNLKSMLFEKRKSIDSAYYHLLKANEFNKQSEWYIDQEKITKNSIDFAVFKEKEKSRYLENISGVMKWGIFILTAGIIIIWFLYNSNRKKHKEIIKQNSLIQRQNISLEQSVHKQSLLLSEVHHRIKNSLQLVLSLLRIKDNDPLSHQLTPYLNEISSKLKSISLIHEQLYNTGEFEKIEMQKYFQNLLTQFNILPDAELTFEYSIKAEGIFLNVETAMPIGIICSELIGNSIKYARIPGKKLFININLEFIENKFVLRYEDNGPGIPKNIMDKNPATVGLMLIKNMVRQLQAESSTSNHFGAHFQMNFVEKIISKV